MLQVLGEIGGRHPALPELALDGIAVGERSLEALEQIGHGRTLREESVG